MNLKERVISELKNKNFPDLKFLFALDTSGVVYLLLQTIAIAILGTLVGAVIAVPLSFLSATANKYPPITTPIQTKIVANAGPPK